MQLQAHNYAVYQFMCVHLCTYKFDARGLSGMTPNAFTLLCTYDVSINTFSSIASHVYFYISC